MAMADSKMLYTAGQGLRHLERGLWAALGLLDCRPRTWRDVWQAMAPDELAPGSVVLGDNFYNKMFEEAKNQLGGYINAKWYFVNVHRHFAGEPRPPGIRAHLSDEGHVLVADLIAREIEAQVLGRSGNQLPTPPLAGRPIASGTARIPTGTEQSTTHP